MASTTTSTISGLGGKLVVELAISGADGEVNHNVTSASSGSIYLIQLDNPNNDSFYLKIRDAGGTSTTPSTATANGAGTPHLMLYCPANQKISYSIPGGFAYSAGVSFWGTTSATVGTVTSPTNSVIVKLVCS
jgi:hypothetical protein